MTTQLRNVAGSSLRERVNAEEWDVRVNLAACYRLAAHFRMTDLIYTHISARVPGPEDHFLINDGEAAGVESAPAHARQDGSDLQELGSGMRLRCGVSDRASQIERRR